MKWQWGWREVDGLEVLSVRMMGREEEGVKDGT